MHQMELLLSLQHRLHILCATFPNYYICKQRHPRSYERTKEAECAHCFVPLEPNAQGLFGRSETHPKAMGAFPHALYSMWPLDPHK